MTSPKKNQVSFENKLMRLALVMGLVPALLLFISLFSHPMSVYLKILILFVVLVTVFFGAYEIRRRVVFQIKTSTNIMEAMALGDYSMRARKTADSGALSEFNRLLNGLTETLSQQQLVTIEKQVLLHKVIDQIDVAIVAADQNSCITLINPAAEKLFNCRLEQMQGWPIKALGLKDVLEGDYRQVVEFEIEHIKKKVYINTDEYFEHGIKQKLIFITDIQHLLREEERQAWQRLLRVLSHEINNSLAPIASISETLARMVNGSEIETELRADLSDGLAVITERSMSLNSFIERYQQLAKLPPPTKTLFDIAPLIRNVAGLFEQQNIQVSDGQLMVFADQSQLQQVMVNLFKNAGESMRHLSEGHIEVSWQKQDGQVTISIVDQGSGINNMDNIFIPFYTTKDNGSGIGLALSRQIIVNHGGDLTLNNRTDGEGVVANIYLPINDN